MASLRASLAQLEKIARAGLVDEDMPRCVQGIAERQFDEFWIHFREYIEDEVPPSLPPPPPSLPPSPHHLHSLRFQGEHRCVSAAQRGGEGGDAAQRLGHEGGHECAHTEAAASHLP